LLLQGVVNLLPGQGDGQERVLVAELRVGLAVQDDTVGVVQVAALGVPWYGRPVESRKVESRPGTPIGSAFIM
jgi:hypothetical protein